MDKGCSLMGDKVEMRSRRVDGGSAVQGSVARYDLNTGARGWTMICDDDVHPDRPIGGSPIGLGYRVTEC